MSLFALLICDVDLLKKLITLIFNANLNRQKAVLQFLASWITGH
jgi:hypothetical protein